MTIVHGDHIALAPARGVAHIAEFDPATVPTAGTRRRRHGARRYEKVLQRDPCAYCGGPGGSVDHIDPVADGLNGWENKTGACEPCNNAKGTTPLIHYLNQRAWQRPERLARGGLFTDAQLAALRERLR